MSGGSFNYLCFKEPNELPNNRDELTAMVMVLSEMGYIDAAKETESVKLVMDHYEARMRARMDRLHDIWKAVEWHRSGDCGPERIAEAIAKYREPVEPSSVT